MWCKEDVPTERLSSNEAIFRVIQSISVGRVPAEFVGYLKQCPPYIQEKVESMLSTPVYLSRGKTKSQR